MMKKVGNWNGARRVTLRLAAEMKAAQKLCLQRFGLKAEGNAKSHISKQDINWEPLAPATLAQKMRGGHSRNIYVMTSSYFQAITSWVTNDTVYAGVKRSATTKDGELFTEIAATLEFGTRDGRIPERPLWRPTLKETIEWHLKNNDPRMLLIKRFK